MNTKYISLYVSLFILFDCAAMYSAKTLNHSINRAVIVFKNIDQLKQLATQKQLETLRARLPKSEIIEDKNLGIADVYFNQNINYYAFIGLCKLHLYNLEHYVMSPEQFHRPLMQDYRSLQKEHETQRSIIQRHKDENRELLGLLKLYTEKNAHNIEECLARIKKMPLRKKRRAPLHHTKKLSKSTSTLPTISEKMKNDDKE